MELLRVADSGTYAVQGSLLVDTSLEALTSTCDSLDDRSELVVDFGNGPREFLGEIRSELIKVRKAPGEGFFGGINLGGEVSRPLEERKTKSKKKGFKAVSVVGTFNLVTPRSAGTHDF